MMSLDLNSFKNIRDEMIWKGSALKQIEAFEALAGRLNAKLEVVSSHTSKYIKLPVVKFDMAGKSFYLRDNFHDFNLCVVSPRPIELTMAQIFEGIQEPLTWTWYLEQIARCRGYTWDYFTDEEMDDPRILRVFKVHKFRPNDPPMEWKVDADQKDRWIKRMKSPEWYWYDWSHTRLFWEGEFGPDAKLWPQGYPFMQGISEVVSKEADQRYQKGCKMFSLALDNLNHTETMIRNLIKS